MTLTEHQRARVARRGARWRVFRGGARVHGQPTWYAVPVDEQLDAMPGRRHALFFSHSEAVKYAHARAAGRTHAEAGRFEYSTLTASRGRQKATQRRHGFASKEA